MVVQPPDRKAAEPHPRRDPSSTTALRGTMATQTQGYKEEEEERKEEEAVVQPPDTKAEDPHPRKDPTSTTVLRDSTALNMMRSGSEARREELLSLAWDVLADTGRLIVLLRRSSTGEAEGERRRQASDAGPRPLAACAVMTRSGMTRSGMTRSGMTLRRGLGQGSPTRTSSMAAAGRPLRRRRPPRGLARRLQRDIYLLIY